MKGGRSNMLEERPQGKPVGSAVPGPLGREVIWVLLDRGMLERWEVRPVCPEEPLILQGIHRRWVWGMRCSTLSATMQNRTTGKKRRAQAQGEQWADLWSGLSVTPSGCWRGKLSAYSCQHISSQRPARALCAGRCGNL